MTSLSISLFGTPEIAIDGRTVTNWPSRAAEAVIAYVALAGRPVPRATLIDLLWPESEPKQAASNLRTILTRVRRELGETLRIDRKTVAMQQDTTVDVLRFVELTGTNATTEQLVEATKLYKGEFLAGFQLRGGYPFEEWMILERERLERRYGSLLKRLVTAHLAAGRYQAGELYARAWVRLDPFHEQATQQLMWLQLRQGKRAAALQSFERLKTLLKNELGVEPLATTQAVLDRAKRARQIGQNNLSPARSALIGRSSELATLIQQLSEPNSRLITLLGMGGMGKTRLAQAIGRKIIAEKSGMFLDGVWFISLVAVETLDELQNRIVGGMGINLRGNRPVHDQLAAHLKSRELLLILDNFEQLVSDDRAVQWVAQLMTAAPDVKLLITSREQLNLYEERIFSLQGLPTDDLDVSPAVALFLQHAERQHVRLERAEHRPILEICQWLDGVPLGIELAASWIKQLSPTEIHATIVADQDFLQTRYRNMPVRQRSLRAVFEHSWELLSAEQQTYFARLAYFPASFDARAAEAIVGASLSTLRDLVGKSLLQSDDDNRFTIHPLLREYGVEKLSNQAQLAAAHASYYLNWIATEFRQLLEVGRDKIEADVPNVRLAWTAAASDELRATAISAVGYYWRLRGWYGEKVVLLARFVDSAHRLLRIRAINELAHVYHWLGNYDASASFYEQGRALTLEEISAERADILEGSGQLEMRRKELPAAIRYLEEAVAIQRQLGNDAELAGTLGILAQAKSYHGEPDDAVFAEAMTLSTYPVTRTNLLAQAGRDQIASGQYAAAMETFAECLRLNQQLNYALGTASAQLNYAIAATYLKRWEVAQAKLDVALAWFENNDEKFGAALIYLHLGMVAEGLDDLYAAYGEYQTAVRIFESMNNPFGLALGEAYLAGASALLNHHDALDKIKSAVTRLHEANSAQLFSTHLAPIVVGLDHLEKRDLAIQIAGFSLSRDYTEAVSRNRLKELVDEWGEAVDVLIERGEVLSAEEIVALVTALKS